MKPLALAARIGLLFFALIGASGGGPETRISPEFSTGTGTAFWSEGTKEEDPAGRSAEEKVSIQRAAQDTQSSLSEWSPAGRGSTSTKVFPPTPAVVIVPIYFHVAYKADGTGLNGRRADGSVYPTQNQIEDQVAQLNRAFSGAEAKKARYTNSMDSRIRFELAGLEYIQNDEAYESCNEDLLMRGHAVTPDRVVNVYTCSLPFNIGSAAMPGHFYCKSTDSAWTPGCRLDGPAPNNHFLYGIRIDSHVLPGGPIPGQFKGLGDGDVLTHEVGHFFGLLHPYQDSCAPGALSDLIADTPRMKMGPRLSCGKNVKDSWSCPQDRNQFKRVDYLGNYMVATFDACRQHFTKGQIQFMQTSIAANKNFF